MSYESRLKEFKELISQIEYLKYTLNSLIYWDKITNMPKGGIEYRSRVMSFMADQQYRLLSGKEFAKHVAFFDGHKKNDEVTDAMIKRIKRNSRFVSKIPEEEYRQYIQLIALSEQVWEKAKEEDDFESFCPYLKKIVETFRSFAEYWGYEDDPYDALLHYYEDDIDVKKIDEIAEQMKEFLVPFIDEVKTRQADHIGDGVKFTASGNEQKELWKMVSAEMGFDFERGRIDIGAHPTILANSPDDVRIVNSYSEKDLRPGMFNVLHSCGKGIYQQSIDRNLLGTFLAEVPSFALEEAIGRFYENIIGRSRGFYDFFYEKMKKIVPELKETGEDEIFARVNTMTASPIRLDADELTYLAHIIIRYEIEKDLINGRIEVKDLPEIWREKYRSYLGIAPKNDREGILQDIHWAAGYMGYFPLYFLSNLTATQIAMAIEREEGKLEDLIRDGRFDVIRRWLTENIFRYGAIYSSGELVETATKEPLNPKYYIDYLRKKYSEVYKLDV